jgi:hypothetical protein
MAKLLRDFHGSQSSADATRSKASLALVAHLITPNATLAITVELAKKCRLMAIQAHPTQLPGTKNTGVDAAQRTYFSTCVANEGKMDAKDSNEKTTPRTDSNRDKMPSDLSPPQTVPR